MKTEASMWHQARCQLTCCASALILINVSLCQGLSAADAARQDDDELMSVILHHLTASREAVRSATYTLNIKTQQSGAPGVALNGGANPAPSTFLPSHLMREAAFTSERRLRVIEAGSRIRVEGRRASEFHHATSSAKQERSTQAVLNDDYHAVWDVDSATVYLHEIESIRSMTRMSRHHLMSAVPTNWMMYGFGVGGEQSLQEMYQRRRDGARWQVTPKHSPDGQVEFLVQRFLTANASEYLDFEAVVSPDQGFLITRHSVFFEDGSPAVEAATVVEQVGPARVWFPVRYTETHYRGWTTGERAPREKSAIERTVNITASDVEVNIDAPPGTFTIESLGLPDGVDVMRTKLDGETVRLTVHRGRLVPYEILQALREHEDDLSNLKWLPDAPATPGPLAPKTPAASGSSQYEVNRGDTPVEAMGISQVFLWLALTVASLALVCWLVLFNRGKAR